jgi:hypothetical protein
VEYLVQISPVDVTAASYKTVSSIEKHSTIYSVVTVKCSNLDQTGPKLRSLCAATLQLPKAGFLSMSSWHNHLNASAYLAATCIMEQTEKSTC